MQVADEKGREDFEGAGGVRRGPVNPPGFMWPVPCCPNHKRTPSATAIWLLQRRPQGVPYAVTSQDEALCAEERGDEERASGWWQWGVCSGLSGI